MKALEGVKIPNFTHVHSGPTCTRLLGWFGADVVKVECAGLEYPPGTKNQTMYK